MSCNQPVTFGSIPQTVSKERTMFTEAVWIQPTLSVESKRVKLTLPENSNIFASKYQLNLPSKVKLKARIEQITHVLESETTP